MRGAAVLIAGLAMGKVPWCAGWNPAGGLETADLRTPTLAGVDDRSPLLFDSLVRATKSALRGRAAISSHLDVAVAVAVVAAVGAAEARHGQPSKSARESTPVTGSSTGPAHCVS